jgi:hypothetical protein
MAAGPDYRFRLKLITRMGRDRMKGLRFAAVFVAIALCCGAAFAQEEAGSPFAFSAALEGSPGDVIQPLDPSVKLSAEASCAFADWAAAYAGTENEWVFSTSELFGAAYLGVSFIDILSVEIVAEYPTVSFLLGASVGYTFPLSDEDTLGISCWIDFPLDGGLTLGLIEPSVNYERVIVGGLSIVAAVKAPIDFAGNRWGIVPWLGVSYSL